MSGGCFRPILCFDLIVLFFFFFFFSRFVRTLYDVWLMNIITLTFK